MRIAIDATTLLIPSAGVSNYIYYWYRALASAAASRHDHLAPFPPGLRVGDVLNHQMPAMGRLRARFWRALVELANLPASPLLEVLSGTADLLHCSQHLARLPKRRITTATIFDLSCWVLPETHRPANVAATKRYGEVILRPCDGLIAISSHARQDAADILRIPLERIQVIYPGVADAFFHVDSREAASVRTRYGLPDSFLLFVGCIEPRKNVRGLIRAYRDLPETICRDVPLVLAGPFGWEQEDVRPLLAGKNIRYLGYVPERDLPGLFRAAEAFVYPSLYEGFGLPVAQAMAVGVPVITSNRSSLPEVVGDAGLIVDPLEVSGLAEAMLRILTCRELAVDLGKRGRSRARRFHWSACADASLDFFHDVSGG
jgi:glycosyltransferase involved in cell wall biosynthesis